MSDPEEFARELSARLDRLAATFAELQAGNAPAEVAELWRLLREAVDTIARNPPHPELLEALAMIGAVEEKLLGED